MAARLDYVVSITFISSYNVSFLNHINSARLVWMREYWALKQELYFGAFSNYVRVLCSRNHLAHKLRMYSECNLKKCIQNVFFELYHCSAELISCKQIISLITNQRNIYVPIKTASVITALCAKSRKVESNYNLEKSQSIKLQVFFLVYFQQTLG